jgi:hypothetical protein
MVVMFMQLLGIGDLKYDDCHVEIVTAISFFGYHYSPFNSGSYWDILNEKLSYSEIHRMLVGGFEVSWMSSPCQDQCEDPYCNLSEITWSLECNPADQCKTLLGIYVGSGRIIFLNLSSCLFLDFQKGA